MWGSLTNDTIKLDCPFPYFEIIVNQMFAMLIHQTEVKRGSTYGLRSAGSHKVVEGSDLKMD